MKKILIFSVFASMLSCAAIMGIQKVKPVNPTNIREVEAKFGINNSFICDTSYYDYFAYNLLKDPLLQKRHTQPLQALYFNQKGEQVAYIMNCNAESNGTNLLWNKNGELNVFPANYSQFADTVKLTTIFRACRIQNIVKIDSTKKTTVVLFWSQFLGRQTKEFIKEFQKNIELSNNSHNVVYVNFDNFFL